MNFVVEDEVNVVVGRNGLVLGWIEDLDIFCFADSLNEIVQAVFEEVVYWRWRWDGLNTEDVRALAIKERFASIDRVVKHENR